MSFLLSTLAFLLTFQSQLTTAFKACPILGAVFPPPTNFESTTIQNASLALTAALESALSNGTVNGTIASFSIEIFSPHSNTSIYTYHHSAPNLNASEGVTTVDSDSVYRMGSISKLISVLTFLIEDGDVHWNDPVTRFVPELAAAARTWTPGQVLNSVDWESVTLENLASHLSGIGRDYYFDDIPASLGSSIGLPVLNASEIAHCTWGQPCAREAFPSSKTPMYNNVAYGILAYALEEITGKQFSAMVDFDVIKKLNLKSTSYAVPNSTNGVISGSAGLSGSFWGVDMDFESPAGNFYSSTSDMAILGKALLSSSLISETQTRRWMKPITHTSDPQLSIGAPWEIFRLQLDSPSRIVDLYSKSGGIGYYTSEFALSSDWDLGFILFVVTPSNSGLYMVAITNLITSIFLPAVEAQAREEADLNYSGTYTSSSTTANYSITITTSPSEPGLIISSILFDGSNPFALLGDPTAFVIRLYPTGLSTLNSDGTKEIGWVMVYENTVDPASTLGPFGTTCVTWDGLGTISYAGVTLNDFTFVVGADGKAISVEPRVARATLVRV